jgi:hypothetical protein
MARDLAVRARLAQGRGDFRALADGQRAAQAEPAAGRGVDHPRRFPQVGLGPDVQRGARVGHRRQQQLGVRVPRAGQHLLDRPGLGDLARVHHDQPVGHVPRAGDVVRDVEKRHALGVAQLRHQVEQADADGHVKHGHRLVGQDQPGLAGEGLGEADPLPLAAAQLVRETAHHVLVEPDHAEDPFRLRLALLAGQPGPVQLERAQHAVRDAEGGVDRAERVLEDHRHLAAVPQPVRTGAQPRHRIAPVHDGPRGRLVDPGEQPGDRGLAAAALPGQRHDLPLADGEAHVVHCVQGPPG